MKYGDREKVRELILQAIREWKELRTDVPLTYYIAEWLLQNDLAIVVRCKECGYYNDDGEYCGMWGECRHPEHFCDEGVKNND